jgi:hypothetical protein
MIVGFGTEFFGTAIYVPSENINIFDAEFIDLFYKLLPVNLSLFGAIFHLFFIILIINFYLLLKLLF